MSNAAYRSFVYFIRCGEYVKIGYSYKPEARLASLKSEVRRGHGVRLPDGMDRTCPLEIVHLVPGCRMKDERILHGVFREHHVAGEWFRYDLAFQRDLAKLQYVTYNELQRQAREARAATAARRTA